MSNHLHYSFATNSQSLVNTCLWRSSLHATSCTPKQNKPVDSYYMKSLAITFSTPMLFVIHCLFGYLSSLSSRQAHQFSKQSNCPPVSFLYTPLIHQWTHRVWCRYDFSFFWNDPRDYGWFLCQRWNETALLAPTSSLLRTNFWKRYREFRKFKQEMGYKTNENKAVAWALSDAGIRDILMTTELFKQKHHIAIHKRTAVQNTITYL